MKQKRLWIFPIILLISWPFFHLTKRDIKIDTSVCKTFGAMDAPHHIIVFEEFACIACRRFHSEDLPYIFANYIDKGLATITFFPTAFVDASKEACVAALIAEELLEEHYLSFLEYLFVYPPQCKSAEEFIHCFMDKHSLVRREILYPSNLHKKMERYQKLCEDLYETEIHLPTILIDQRRIKDISLKSIEEALK